MKLLICISFIAGLAFPASAQTKSYIDSLKEFRDNYIKTHGAVLGNDRKSLHFFPIDAGYRVTTRVEKIYEAPWFKMETSGKERKVHRVYALLHFTLNNQPLKLYVYQSQELMGMKEYSDYLFIPFTDLTTGEESYENGRYIEMLTGELEKGSFVLDFNKAYNPYCAYGSGKFNCPLPPKENNLPVAIRAGELKFGKQH